jgi:hypothetical protein
LIDRRFYRKKYDARKTPENFSTKLREVTVQPAHIYLWLRPDTTSNDS